MANVDSVFGARVAQVQRAGSYSGKVNSYTVLASDATALFVGDFVKLTGTSGPNEEGLQYPVVTQAAANNTLVGVVVGFKPQADNLSRIYRPASTLRTAYVADDPYELFEIQASSDAAIVVGDVGLNADITVGSGSIYTGLSGMELDQTTLTASTEQLRILRLMPGEDNEFGLHAKLLCMINEHQYKTTSGV